MKIKQIFMRDGNLFMRSFRLPFPPTTVCSLSPRSHGKSIWKVLFFLRASTTDAPWALHLAVLFKSYFNPLLSLIMESPMGFARTQWKISWEEFCSFLLPPPQFSHSNFPLSTRWKMQNYAKEKLFLGWNFPSSSVWKCEGGKSFCFLSQIVIKSEKFFLSFSVPPFYFSPFSMPVSFLIKNVIQFTNLS